MANSRFYSNTAQQTTLSGSISSGATSINVGATTGFPPTTPYTLALDYGAATEELVSVTGVAGTTLTVTRGYGGTSAQSHSLGAVVRHVYDSTDATDFRTHEAATAAVHGVTGALVGTSDAQTLTNKTLTSPTVNGATVTGTVAGTHAYSGALTFSNSLTSSGASLAGSWGGAPFFTGNPTFSGNPQFTGMPKMVAAVAATDVLGINVLSDAFDRVRVSSEGAISLGSGAAARDLTVYRAAAKMLGVIGTVRAEPTDTALDGLAANLPSGAVGDLLNLRVNSAIQAAIGPDGQFRTYGGNAPTTYTPTWNNIGTATFTRNLGWYWKIGKLVFIEVYAQFASGPGTGTSGINFSLPSTPFREGSGAGTTRQFITGWADAMNIMSPGSMFAPVFAGDSGPNTGTLRMYDYSQLQTQHLQAGTIFTIQGYYREV